MEEISNTIRSQFVLNPISTKSKPSEELNFFLHDEFLIRYPQCINMTYEERVLHALSYEVNRYIIFYKRHKESNDTSNINQTITPKTEEVNYITNIKPASHHIFRANRMINLVNKSYYYTQDLKIKNLCNSYNTEMKTRLEKIKKSHTEYIQFLYDAQDAIEIDTYKNGVLILDEKYFISQKGIKNSIEITLLMIGLFIVLPDPEKPNKLKIIFDTESLDPNLLTDYINSINTDIEFEFYTLHSINRFNKTFSTKNYINKTCCALILSAFEKIQKHLEDKPLALEYHIDANTEINGSIRLPSKLAFEEIKLTEEALFVIDLYLEKSRLNLIKNHELTKLKTITKAIACLLIVSPEQIKKKLWSDPEYPEIFYMFNVQNKKIIIEYGYKKHFQEPLITLPTTLFSIQLSLNKLHSDPKAILPDLIKQDIANFAAIIKNLMLKSQEEKMLYLPALAIVVYVEILLLQNRYNSNITFLRNDIPMSSSIVSLVFCGIALEKVLHDDIYKQQLNAARKIVIATAPAIFMTLHSAGETVYKDRFKFLHALCIESHKVLYKEDNILAIDPNYAIDTMLSIAEQLFVQIWPNEIIESTAKEMSYRVFVDGNIHEGYTQYLAELTTEKQYDKSAISLAETTIM